MLINSVGLKLISVFIIVGVIFGLIFDLFKLIKIVVKNNILVVNVLDFFAMLICGALFIVAIFRYSYGSLALFMPVLCVIGVLFEQIIVEILFTSPIKWVYNKFNLKKVKKSFPEISC